MISLNFILSALATATVCIGAVLIVRKVQARRAKKCVRECRRQHQAVQRHPLPKAMFVVVCEPEHLKKLEKPDYEGMRENLLAHAEQLGQELVSE